MYATIFEGAIHRPHAEGRYRVSVNILRGERAFRNVRCVVDAPVEVWHRPALRKAA